MKNDLELQLKVYGLTTAEILYRMPDTPAILQTFIWQNLDLAPHFPELRKFLDFWEARLDGPRNLGRRSGGPAAVRGERPGGHVTRLPSLNSGLSRSSGPRW